MVRFDAVLTSGQTNTRFNVMLNGTRYDIVQTVPDYLTFTANSAGSTVGMTNYNGNSPDMEYSFDKSSWYAWDYSDITLPNIGSKVYFRGNNSSGFSSNAATYSKFVMNGSIAGSGNITSLLDGVGNPISIPNDWCFCLIFMGCTSLTTPVEMPSLQLRPACYANAYNGCTSLLYPPNLPAPSLANACYSGMFRFCSSLSITDSPTGATAFFTCPSDAPSSAISMMFGSTHGPYTADPVPGNTYYYL